MLNVFWFAFIGKKREFVLVHASVGVFVVAGTCWGGDTADAVGALLALAVGLGWRWRGCLLAWRAGGGGCSAGKASLAVCWESATLLSAGRCSHTEGPHMLC